MTELKIGDYIEIPGKNGEIVVRAVYIGDDQIIEYRQYRNIITNEISDWRPAEGAKPTKLNDQSRALFMARKISA